LSADDASFATSRLRVLRAMQRNDDGGALGRLNAMGDPPEPLVIVPATPPPDPDRLGGMSTQPMPRMEPPLAATVIQPAAEPLMYAEQPAVVVPQAVAPIREPFVEPISPPRRDWGPVIAAAFVALLVGGLIGFLLGRGSDNGDSVVSSDTSVATTIAPDDQAVVDQRVDDIFTMLLAQAQDNGSVVLPTPFPKLDQLLALSSGSTDQQTSDAQAAVAALQTERDDLAAQLAASQDQATTLQDQLTMVTADRDNLQSQLAENGSSAEQLADQQAQIDDLQNQLESAQADVDTARGDLQAVQADLDEANAALEALHVTPADNVVGRPVNDVRNLARTNGWQLVERPVDSKSAVDTVTAQMPAPGTNMIRGSVLYIEVAQPPK
jgi:flagellar biosynthesis chaperone FliJ